MPIHFNGLLLLSLDSKLFMAETLNWILFLLTLVLVQCNFIGCHGITADFSWVYVREERLCSCL